MFIKLERSSGKYKVKGDTLYVRADRVGLALKAYDHHDNVTNWNGIYGLDMKVDGELSYEFLMESFAFDETRFINAHLDYRGPPTEEKLFQSLFYAARQQALCLSQLD